MQNERMGIHHSQRNISSEMVKQHTFGSCKNIRKVSSMVKYGTLTFWGCSRAATGGCKPCVGCMCCAFCVSCVSCAFCVVCVVCASSGICVVCTSSGTCGLYILRGLRGGILFFDSVDLHDVSLFQGKVVQAIFNSSELLRIPRKIFQVERRGVEQQ